MQTCFPILLSMSSVNHPKETRAEYHAMALQIQILRYGEAISSSLSRLMQTCFPIQLSMSSNNRSKIRMYCNTIAYRIQMLRCRESVFNYTSHPVQTCFHIQINFSLSNTWVGSSRLSMSNSLSRWTETYLLIQVSTSFQNRLTRSCLRGKKEP